MKVSSNPNVIGTSSFLALNTTRVDKDITNNKATGVCTGTLMLETAKTDDSPEYRRKLVHS